MIKEKKQLWVIAVDLDGVILEFDYDKWEADPMYFGEPKPGVISALKRLREMGYRIIIHTARLSGIGISVFSDIFKSVLNALNRNNIPYDEIWTLEGKPPADHYIDDKAIRFESWEQAMDVIVPPRK